MNGAEFLRGVVKAFPYAIHTVLTDNGMLSTPLECSSNLLVEISPDPGGDQLLI